MTSRGASGKSAPAIACVQTIRESPVSPPANV
jgi:hypothetical protein